jgi:outer membrane protein OmpA-like peptidoglycan-associated protein
MHGITGRNPTLYFTSEVTICMRTIFISVLLLAAFIAKAQTRETLVIYFDFDRHNLTPGSIMQIDSLIKVQQARDIRITKIELSGHCDFIGSDGYNDSLSAQRVNTVKEAIQALNIIKPELVTAAAYGEKKPANVNRTDDARRLNRRVEIVLTTELAETMAREEPISIKEWIADTVKSAGVNFVLKNINFYGGMHRLLPESQPMLTELVDAMKTYPALVIEIQGHICCEPRPGDGMDLETGVYNLSTARAKAIYDHLAENGIQTSRLSYKGFGHSQPLYPFPEQSEEERSGNRRVEIKIISK